MNAPGQPMGASRGAGHDGMPVNAANRSSLGLRAETVTLRAGATAAGRVLFAGLSFDVDPGQCWVVLGPNGAGKSSLLAALAGLMPAASGRILLDDRPIADWTSAALATQRAWCPQFWSDPFPASVRETIGLARHRGLWGSSLAPEGLQDDVIDSLIDRLDLRALADDDVRQLSGGERQRVALATMALQGAAVWLLDEPAAHLDLAHQQQLLCWLRNHAGRGGSIVASVHDLNLAWDLATHAVLLPGDCSRAALAGPRDEVMRSASLSAAFSVPIERVEVCGEQRFWIGPAAPRGSAGPPQEPSARRA